MASLTPQPSSRPQAAKHTRHSQYLRHNWLRVWRKLIINENKSCSCSHPLQHLTQLQLTQPTPDVQNEQPTIKTGRSFPSSQLSPLPPNHGSQQNKQHCLQQLCFILTLPKGKPPHRSAANGAGVTFTKRGQNPWLTQMSL